MNAHDRRAEIVELADQCVQCGACLPHCPTYAESGRESESPRGRIVIAKALAGERLDPADAANSIGHCLACRACEAVCPAKVDYGRLLLDARARTATALPRNRRQRALAWLIEHPSLLALAMRMASLARRMLPGLRTRIPPIPTSRPTSPPAVIKTPRGRLWLFEGCVASHLDRDVHHAARRVLNALGWEVIDSGRGLCCGSLHAHAGEATRADSLAATTANRLRQATAIDAAILCSSGCFETLRNALAPLPVYELMDFVGNDKALAQIHWRAAGADGSVALHTPCTQRNVVRQPQAAERSLAQIPGLRIDAGLPTVCCGASGDLRLGDTARAARFAVPHLDALARSGCMQLASSNVGCRAHLELELRVRGSRARTLHPIELLADHLP